ncbi:hypothetical protein KXS07_36530 [Inquilinus limosus]|uniref:hypothetical protein n=1 Tax=Inquilinus limosus TaxID=171674 RepID=UPI003F170CF9
MRSIRLKNIIARCLLSAVLMVLILLLIAWLYTPPVRAQDAPTEPQGPSPTVGLGSLPGDNTARGTLLSARIAGIAALHVEITIAAGCSIGRDVVPAVPGPWPDGKAADVAGSIAINCTSGLPYLLALDTASGIETIPGRGTGAPVSVPFHARATVPAGRQPAASNAPIRLTVAY